MMQKVTSRSSLKDESRSQEGNGRKFNESLDGSNISMGPSMDLDDWRKAISAPTRYRVGSASIHMRPRDIIQVVLVILVVVGIIVVIYNRGTGLSPSHIIGSSIMRLSKKPYNSKYPLTEPLLTRNGMKFRIAVITDLDHGSKVKDSLWMSHFLKGYLTMTNDKTFEVEFDSKSTDLHSSLGQGGRGMELSELVVFNGNLITVDDRTGVVYKIMNEQTVPWLILSDGPGDVSKGFKSEWATVKDEYLYIGGLGKEWTTSTGEVVNLNPQYVKRIGSDGSVEHIDWHKHYDMMRDTAGFPKPGNTPRRQQLDFRCRCECHAKFSAGEKETILRTFNEIADHEKQNIYLRGGVTMTDINDIRRRPRNEGAATRQSYRFRITTSSHNPVTKKVCKGAYCALHGIKETRLKRKVLDFSHGLQEGRGKHGHQPKLPEEVREAVRQHIRSFPARESHYSRSKNQSRKYLDANLTVTKMLDMFGEKYQQFKDQVKYWLYHDIFTHEFNISFGNPRSDICDVCEKYVTDINAAKQSGDQQAASNLQTDHELHKRKGDAFTTQIQEMTALAKGDPSVHALCMDFEKNLPLPLTGIGQEYYKRQLWVHNFGMHDCGTGQATMFLYAEHYAQKGPNEVLSCLDYYLHQLSDEVRHIHIFADNAFAQNKNRYILAYVQHLTSSYESVSIHYPISGHSRMPCDRDFGLIEKKRRKEDRVVLPSQWIEVIKSANRKNPFHIVHVEKPLTDDSIPDGTPTVVVKDYKAALDPLIRSPQGIAQYRGLLAERGCEVRGRVSMTGLATEDVKYLRRGVRLAAIVRAIRTAPSAYSGYLPIKPAKHADVQALLQHVHLPETVNFYKNIKPLSLDGDEEEDDYE